ncbi:uncharacterized protein LY89DRAFT_757031 [Mollisia scopiformis]|uniref:Uncharacterized protein n=1 Tax=Mollisia scopiformis TaxID=149040 RepID=A0A194WX01_MOLSC|nr:uncharacterized protein LY89DRAFT_757031 [Mollisia scopiformis]KUJ12508.1 hypothetical protein LY89DRAFT_757031 [Mollisia scopiformis]
MFLAELQGPLIRGRFQLEKRLLTFLTEYSSDHLAIFNLLRYGTSEQLSYAMKLPRPINAMIRTAVQGSKQGKKAKFQTFSKCRASSPTKKNKTTEATTPWNLPCILPGPEMSLPFPRSRAEPGAQTFPATEVGGFEGGGEDIWTYGTGATSTGIGCGIQPYGGWQPVPREMIPKDEKVWGPDGEVVFREQMPTGGEGGSGVDVGSGGEIDVGGGFDFDFF